MSEIKTAKSEPVDLFWGTAEDTRFGMLGFKDEDQHLQPMTHFVDRDRTALWFMTSRDTDLARTAGEGWQTKMSGDGPEVWFTIVSKGQDVQICAKGRLIYDDSAEMKEELWNPVVGAWFEGKDDPNLALYRLDLEEAAIWASTDSSFAFAWQIAKAQQKDKEPEVGTHTVINF
ncbi:pyridoxamine 5'-phosphate oxidase family protein [Maritimibacter sp. UBA3975]|uniref:pyridoxamine 5'-phosphate oxidase family protein n=1 Tax=Maritimibacter sp. UBA3975 TaxID=1946833 RepID=UPI000C0A63E2|nr:pyridoxamine 5'-phosphate oxidase family protein [Maritimibacter sp. UBA3975]MAM63067.1 general stress protein [Maritimibacter sp.]|tara:strand:+ start:5019 stop:5540 length:522 start_codon:yes stop_codon:yes gene_type:complete